MTVSHEPRPGATARRRVRLWGPALRQLLPRRVALVLAGLAVAGLGGVPAAGAADVLEQAGAERALEAVRVELGGQEMVLPALVDGGAEYVSLKAIAAALGARFERPAAGRFLVTADAASADFSVARPSLVLVESRSRASKDDGGSRDAAAAGEHGRGGRTLSLQDDARVRDGDLFVPSVALGALVAALEADEAHDAATVPGAGAPRWMLSGAGPGALRLDLALPHVPASVSTSREPGGVHVVRVPLDAPLVPPWATRRFGSPILESLRAEVHDGVLTVRIAGGPRLAEVRAERREEPPGVEIVLSSGEVPGESSANGAAGRSADDPGDAGSAVRLAQSPRRVRRVVIDPGHGGAEEGALGPNGLVEKELVLDVARRLAALLRLEGFDVLLTRNADVDLPLDARAAVANEHGADLFVSLHANASRFGGAYGAETYFLSAEATDDAARTLAALENDAASGSAVPTAGDAAMSRTINPSGELPLILWDMAQVAYLEESARLAETIQRRLNRLLDIRDRGVRQAPFRVLVGATCPAVLVELGFVTNRDEAGRLATDGYRSQLAEALRDAIATFRGAGPSPASGVTGSAP